MDTTITSKFKTESLFNALFVFVIAIVGSFLFLMKVLAASDKNEFIKTVLGTLFFGAIFCISIFFLDVYKYLRINLIKKEIKYYSLLNPFGKRIKFNDFKGCITSKEIALDEEIYTIYFVNTKGFTGFKINSSHYKNASIITNVIPLKEIKNYEFNFWRYLKLIFTVSIKVITKEVNKDKI